MIHLKKGRGNVGHVLLHFAKACNSWHLFFLLVQCTLNSACFDYGCFILSECCSSWEEKEKEMEGHFDMHILNLVERGLGQRLIIVKSWTEQLKIIFLTFLGFGCIVRWGWLFVKNRFHGLGRLKRGHIQLVLVLFHAILGCLDCSALHHVYLLIYTILSVQQKGFLYHVLLVNMLKD